MSEPRRIPEEAPKLLPCPFCGGEAHHPSEIAFHLVECRQCGARIETADDWNRRDPCPGGPWLDGGSDEHGPVDICEKCGQGLDAHRAATPLLGGEPTADSPVIRRKHQIGDCWCGECHAARGTGRVGDFGLLEVEADLGGEPKEGIPHGGDECARCGAAACRGVKLVTRCEDCIRVEDGRVAAFVLHAAEQHNAADARAAESRRMALEEAAKTLDAHAWKASSKAAAAFGSELAELTLIHALAKQFAAEIRALIPSETPR